MVVARSAAARAGEPPQDQPSAGDPQAPVHSVEKLKVGKYEVSEADLAAMMERQAQDDLKKLTLPQKPEDYKLELPPDLKLSGNVEYKFDQNDPSLVAAKNWGHKHGLTQDAVSEILGIYATHEAQQNAIIAERSRAEIAKAGVNAPQRVDAVGKWLDGFMGTEEAKQIRALIVTDRMLRFN